MSWIKSDNKIEQKHFDFLEELRQSGVTNMLGADPYLTRAFPTHFRKHDAGEVLLKWMKAHDDPTLLYVEPAKRKKSRKTKKEQAV